MRVRLWFGLQLIWLATVLILGIWWGRLLLIQAERIDQLESKAGILDSAHSLARMERMVFWESFSFLALVVGITAVIVVFYMRDVRRARGIQAFFASVTHELRTPLSSIRLQAESIAESLKDGASEHALIRRLLEDTLRLEGQVERTLELARVEGGGSLYVESLRVKPWLNRVMRSWQETYGVRLKIVDRLGDVSIHADPAGLQVVVRNLIENALRHSKKDSVTVTISNEGATLIFKDDGEGYAGDPVRLGQIFMKGQGSAGAGVGLYLVRGLMKRMGGNAVFKSENGFEARLVFGSDHE